MQILPFTSDLPRYTFTTTLDGEVYAFAVHWNQRDGAWYFDVLEEDGTAIVHGIKIVLGANLGRAVRHPLFDSWVWRAVDASGQNLDAGRSDLGQRVHVIRRSLAEFMAIRAGLP